MAEPATVRRATAADAGALALVGAATFLETFAGLLGGPDIVAHCRAKHAEAVYAAWLADPACALWVAAASPGDAAVGFAVLTPPDLPLEDPRPGDLELKRIYLLRRFQGGGVGRALMQVALDEARRRGATRLLLGVFDQNAKALEFYAKAGFAVIGDRPFTVGQRVCHDLVLARELG